MANLSNINNILRTGSLGVGINRDPLGAFEISSATKPGIKMFNTAASGKTYEAYSDTNGNYIIYDQDADDNRFVINSAGNATFAGNVLAPRYNIDTDSTSIIQETNRMKFTNAIANDAGGFDFYTRNSGSTYINALQILGTGNATFAGNVTLGSSSKASDEWMFIDSDNSSSAGIQLLRAGAAKWFIYNPSGTNNFKIYDNSGGGYMEMAVGGNTTFTGNVISGGSGTFASSVTVNTNDSNILTLNRNSTVGGYMVFRNDNSDKLYIGSRGTVSGSGGAGYDIFTVAGNDLKLFTSATLALTLDTSQNATFSGDVHAGGRLRSDVGSDSGSQLNLWADSNGHTFLAGYDFAIYTGGNNARTQSFIINSSKNATFAGNVTTGGQVTVPSGYSVNIGTSRIHSTATSYLLGGNVGIGTSSPTAKLEIYSTATFNSRTSGINVHRPGSYGQYGSFSYNSDTTYFSSTYTGAGASYYGSFIWEQFNNGIVGREAMRINTDGNVGIQETGPATRMQINGCLGIGSAVNDGNITRTFTNFSQQDGGSLHINIGLGGGSSSGDTITFEYAALSWKSWSLVYNFASTSGIAYGVAGGYWNNSGGSTNQTQQNNLGVSVAITHNGQSNLITFTFTNLGTHAMANFVYMQAGGDGQPKASRVTITANS